MQFDVTEFLYIDRVGSEDGITTEDEGVPTVDKNAVVTVVGSEVYAIARVGRGHWDVACCVTAT